MAQGNEWLNLLSKLDVLDLKALQNKLIHITLLREKCG